jgi:CBS domain-containing protein
MNKYQELKSVDLAEYSTIVSPGEVASVDLDSPAQLVVTDFNESSPLILRPEVGVDEAIAAMRRAHVRSVLVTDDKGSFRGIVTVADLESRKVLSLATSSGQSRSDLTIGELMTPKAKLKGVPVSAIESGNIGELLQTLRNVGQPHMLVVDPDHHAIRGIISSSDIARRLNVPVEINQRATSFRELVEVISAGREVS